MSSGDSDNGSPPRVACAPEDLEALGEYAMRFVRKGQTVGLGTGRAASAFIRALGASGIEVHGVATSIASERLARAVGISTVPFDGVPRIDIDFDGADEVDPKLNLIKGYGGALVRERVIAASAKKLVVLVGEEKLVERLGERRKLPIEVVPFAAPLVLRRVEELGLPGSVRSNADGGEFVTDNGGMIIDCRLLADVNPVRLEHTLLAIPGVVGTGFFLSMANLVLVAEPGGKVREIKHRR